MTRTLKTLGVLALTGLAFTACAAPGRYTVDVPAGGGPVIVQTPTPTTSPAVAVRLDTDRPRLGPGGCVNWWDGSVRYCDPRPARNYAPGEEVQATWAQVDAWLPQHPCPPTIRIPNAGPLEPPPGTFENQCRIATGGAQPVAIKDGVLYPSGLRD